VTIILGRSLATSQVVEGSNHHRLIIRREAALERQDLYVGTRLERNMRFIGPAILNLPARLFKSSLLPVHPFFVRHPARKGHALRWPNQKTESKTRIIATTGDKADLDLVKAFILTWTTIEAKVPMPGHNQLLDLEAFAKFGLLVTPCKYQLAFLDFILSTCHPYRLSLSIGRHCMTT
jgi:hypothetical protein